MATTITFTTVSPETSELNQPYSVSIRAASSLATPTVSVTIDDGTGASCNATLDADGNASCELTSTTPGIKVITATYNGDTLVNGAKRRLFRRRRGPHHHYSRGDRRALVALFRFQVRVFSNWAYGNAHGSRGQYRMKWSYLFRHASRGQGPGR